MISLGFGFLPKSNGSKELLITDAEGNLIDEKTFHLVSRRNELELLSENLILKQNEINLLMEQNNLLEEIGGQLKEMNHHFRKEETSDT